jgi:hypothetical protein
MPDRKMYFENYIRSYSMFIPGGPIGPVPRGITKGGVSIIIWLRNI